MGRSVHSDSRWNDCRLEVSLPEDSALKGYDGDLVLAWARDRISGQPRYIGELRPEQTGRSCGCNCYSCELELEAVNAGQSTWRRRPHFRHPAGAQKDDCVVLAARAAALEILKMEGMMFLPKRSRSTVVEGLSGSFYEAWVEKPVERVKIADFKLRDKVSALLTLEDGRKLLVELVGSLDADTTSSHEVVVTPTIRVVVDDPSIAGMSPEEIRQRLSVIVEAGTWCSHWCDEALALEAMNLALEKARKSLDWLDEALYEFPDGTSVELKRETLLHLKAKEILAKERVIRVPEISGADILGFVGRGAQYQANTLPEQTIALESVAIERRVGQIRPDVVATMREMIGWHADDLLVEITVTNSITEERRDRIQAENRPAIEIDLSRMGGRVTEEEFTRLIVEEVAGKRWLHHPWLNTERARLKLVRDAEIALVKERRQERIALEHFRREVAARSNELLVAGFLDAIKIHGNLRAKLDSPDGDQRHVDQALGHVRLFAEEFANRGFPEARDDFLFAQSGNILERLISIRLDEAIGYNLKTSWQVINAILQEKYRSLRWHSLYLIAIKVYEPTLTVGQSRRVLNWGEEVKASVRGGEDRYLRDGRYDELLSRLFPEMASALKKPTLRISEHIPHPKHVDVVAQMPKGGFWLEGSALEAWKRKYPEAAASWFGVRKDERR